MNRMPDKPWQELLVALAGPMVNIVIAIGLIAATGAADLVNAAEISNPTLGLLQRLAATNLFLAIFNLVPAFPMDGGRVLRAGLAMWIGQDKATRIAAAIGQILAFLLGFLGLFGHPMLIFIAIFVFMAAAGEAQMTSMAEAARNLDATAAMETKIAAIDRVATVREAIDLLLATSQDVFPMVDQSGRLHGLLGRTEIMNALQSIAPDAPIAPFAHPAPPTIRDHETVGAALPHLNAGDPVGVVDSEGRLVGLLTRQSLAEIMMIREMRPDWRFGRNPENPGPVA